MTSKAKSDIIKGIPSGFACPDGHRGKTKASARKEGTAVTLLELYKDEETESSFGYPPGFQFKSAAEKLAVLAPHFPGLDGSHVGELARALTGTLPEGAEELLIYPKWTKVGHPYHEALNRVLEILGKSRAFRNWRQGELGPNRIHLIDKLSSALAQLEEATPGDYLVIPMQSGLRHRGRSVRRARACFAENEFGLGPYEVAIYLLSCPERFTRWEDLAIDCAGADYRFGDAPEFDYCLCFGFGGDELRWGGRWTDCVHDDFGSASGFVR